MICNLRKSSEIDILAFIIEGAYAFLVFIQVFICCWFLIIHPKQGDRATNTHGRNMKVYRKNVLRCGDNKRTDFKSTEYNDSSD